MPKPKELTVPKTREKPAHEKRWLVIVHNDPVNTMEYVIVCFIRVLQMDRAEANRCMLEIHRQGSSPVWKGARERAEGLVHELQHWHLRAELRVDA